MDQENIVAQNVFDIVNQAEFFTDKSVQILLIKDTPWFKAKDIANILGYKNTNLAVKDHVKDKNKEPLKRLMHGGISEIGLSFNEEKTIYINEAGLYQLIMKSKLKEAEAFQDWVTDDLLPKIRKTGQEKYLQELCAERALLLQSASQLEAEKTARIEAERKLAYAENRQLRLENFMNATKKLETREVIYIGTTDAYQRQNRFKVGGCSSIQNLPGRFSSYNSGRPRDDRFFCAQYWLVHSYEMIEKISKTLLVNFKDKGNKKGEDYHIHGEVLISALEFIIKNSDESVEWFNERMQDFVSKTINSEPVLFEPVDIGRRTLCIVAGDQKFELDDITNWSEEQIRAEMDSIFEFYMNHKNITRLEGHTIAWGELSDIIRNRHKNTKMMVWRNAFKTYAPRKSDRLRIKGLGI